MSFKDYIRSKTIVMCFICISALLTYILMVLLNAGIPLMVCAEGTILIVCFLWFSVNYIICKRRLAKLNRIENQLEEKYLLGEILPEPKDEVEEQYYNIMKRVSGSAIEAIEKAKRDKEDYCHYVESWIHEIKTPLTACSLILENGGDASKLKKELKKVDNLTETILYYARIKSPEKDTILRKFSVSEVINQAVKSQMELLISAGVSLEVYGDFVVVSDDKALGFIIKQLLVNSAKYCPHCHVTITCTEGTITYEDNGIGIPSYEVSRVADRGFTGTNGRKLGSSTGMGLYIVRELCRHLNIRLHIDSEEGRFTRICLSYDSLTKV